MIRRLSAVLILILACPTVAWAATNSLHEGAWGLEFQVQAPIYGYNAAGIALIRHFSDRSAMRLGTMVGIRSQDTDGTRSMDRAFPYDTLQTSVQTPSYDDTRDVSLFLHLVRYLSVGTRLGMLIEGGPSARWQSYEYGRTDSYPPPNGTYSHSSDGDSWSYGVDLQAGFEWFFRARLSLAGRYGFTAQRTEGKQTERYDFYNPNDGAWDRSFSDTHSDGYSVQTTPAIISLIGYW
jgi:hypothetical protein